MTPEECNKERDDAYATANKDQAEYDKQLLTLSSGFLAVSLAFIKDVVPLGTAIHLNFLNWSFILLASCIVLVLSSYQFSIRGLLKAKTYWEARARGENPKFPGLHAKWIGVVNCICGMLFVVAVGLTVYFVISNVNREAQMSKNLGGIAQDGQIIKVPSNPAQNEKGAHMKVPPATPVKPAGNANDKK